MQASLVTISRYFYHSNFLPFQLGNVNIILGTEWLCSLGEMKARWESPTMKFMWERKQMELKGDLSLTD